MRIARLLAGLIGLATAMATLAQPAPLKGLDLSDAQGRRLQADALRGHVVLLQLVFTGCGTVCPPQVRELAAVHDALAPEARRAVRFVSVSLDPHDRPADLAAFARRLDAVRAGWTFARGDAASIDQLARRLQAFGPGGLADHRTALYVFDARGELMQRFAGVPVDRPRLQRELTRLALDPPLTARRAEP